MSATAPTTGPRASWRLRALRLLPTCVAALWIVGVAQFRGWPMGRSDYAVLIAFLLAMQTIRRRIRPKERPLDLGALKSPHVVALLVGLITATMATLLGGLFEAVAMRDDTVQTAWWLRTLWHAACAFGASYCSFLARIEASVKRAD